jgi:hypothetical protein
MKAQAPSLFFTIARMPLTPRPALKRQQDGLYSELLEIEKSVYISSDVNLWEMDRDEALEVGREWGGCSAGDLTGSPKVCASISMGHPCHSGHLCKDRHNKSSNFKREVCTFWMRSVCKKNKMCDRLHQYDLERMPHCRFFTSGCLEPACIYQHKDDNKEERGNCIFYARGFCKNGPKCSRNHNTQVRFHATRLSSILRFGFSSIYHAYLLFLTMFLSPCCVPIILRAFAPKAQVTMLFQFA